MSMPLARNPVLQTHGKGKDFLGWDLKGWQSLPLVQVWTLVLMIGQCIQTLSSTTSLPDDGCPAKPGHWDYWTPPPCAGHNKQSGCVVGTLCPRKHSPSSGHVSVCVPLVSALLCLPPHINLSFPRPSPLRPRQTRFIKLECSKRETEPGPFASEGGVYTTLLHEYLSYKFIKTWKLIRKLCRTLQTLKDNFFVEKAIVKFASARRWHPFCEV